MPEFRTNPKSWEEVRRVLQRIKTKVTDLLGTMSTQNADSVSITGGEISGSDVDVTGQSLALDDKQVNLSKIGTAETDTTKAAVPDGTGGIAFTDAGTVHDRLHGIDSALDHEGVEGATEGAFVVFDANGLPKSLELGAADFDSSGEAVTQVNTHEINYDHSLLHEMIHTINDSENHDGVPDATEDNLVSFDEYGLPKDSGYSASDLGGGSPPRWKRWMDT
jgi:hypothetical protein